MKIFVILLLSFGLVYGVYAEVNEKYSYKDFMHQSFKHLNEDEFNGKGDIVGSCFYQEARASDDEPSKEIFPDDMRGVRFIECNLDNVKLPPGNFLGEGNSHRKIKVQPDGFDWELDNDNKPIKSLKGREE